MKQFLSSRIVKAVAAFLLGSAVIHIILIVVHSCMTLNFSMLNFFDILDFDLFYPQIAVGPASFIVSTILIVGFIAGIFFILPKKLKNASK
jgi:hypothetical protein